MSADIVMSLGRALLGAAHRRASDDDDDHADHADEESTENTLDVRIAAIFAILAAGLIGAFFHWSFGFRNASHPATLLIRALSAGVILALALIHVIPDGAADLSELTDYPAASCCVVFGVLAMVMIENSSRSYMAHDHAHGAHAHCHDIHNHGSGNKVHTVGHTHSATAGCSHDHSHDHDHNIESPRKADQSSQDGKSESNVPIAATGVNLTSHFNQEVKEFQAYSHGHTVEQAHTHSCVAVNNAAHWASAQPTTEDTLSNQIMAYMFELACVIHSFLIGIALGVTVDSRSTAIALLIALVFHQGLEGVGLGSVVVKANFTLTKSIIMICTYSIMTPLGVAIGIGIAGTYDPEAAVALGVQGVLNSISGGLLLYISLVQLIAEDFTRSDMAKAGGWLFRLASYAALMLGAAFMAVIAIWN